MGNGDVCTAFGSDFGFGDDGGARALAEQNFNRIASFAVPGNMAAGEDRARVSSAEIIAASDDGTDDLHH